MPATTTQTHTHVHTHTVPVTTTQQDVIMTEGTTQFSDDLQLGQKKSLGQKIKEVFTGNRTNDPAYQ